MTQDLRLACRMLWRAPAFSAIAILTLALGIGANTAIFSVIDGAILTPLNFEHSDRILRVWSRSDQRNLPFFSVAAPDYLDWKESARAFDAIAAYDRQRAVVVTGEALPEEVQAARMTADVFSLLGTAMALGRGFTAEEDRPGGPPVVIVTHGFWQRRLGGSPAAIGRPLVVDGQAHTIVGVLPRGVTLPNNPADLLTPSRISRAEADTQRGSHNLRVLARLRPGVSAAEGRAELERLAAAQAVAFPGTNGGWTCRSSSVGIVTRRNGCGSLMRRCSYA
jgi:putative ABC transport system permease protein